MNGILKQNLLHLWKKLTNDIKHVYSFEEIVGHDNIKQIFAKAILSKRPLHLLLVGSPGVRDNFCGITCRLELIYLILCQLCLNITTNLVYYEHP